MCSRPKLRGAWHGALLAVAIAAALANLAPARAQTMPTVVNGDFSQGLTGWTVLDTASYVSGGSCYLKFFNGIYYPGISQSISGFQQGSFYRLEFEFLPDVSTPPRDLYRELAFSIDEQRDYVCSPSRGFGANALDSCPYRTDPFQVTGGSHTIQLHSANSVSGMYNCMTGGPYNPWTVVDNVRLVPTIADGGAPRSAPTLARDGNLYGMTTNPGVFYKRAQDGTYTIVARGVSCNGSLIQGITPDDNFYGTAGNTVFRISPSGTYQVLHTFTSGSTTDGYAPIGGLTQTADGTLYGTTSQGGQSNCGFLYSLNPQTLAYQAVCDLNTSTTAYGYSNGSFVQYQVHALGTHPMAAPSVGADGKIYFPTSSGGTTPAPNQQGAGTIDRYDPTYHSGTVLVNGNTSYRPEYAITKLTLASDNILYGTAGATSGAGMLYGINTSGQFTGYWSGAYIFPADSADGPNSSVIERPEGTDGHTFYGTRGPGTGVPGEIYRITQTGGSCTTSFGGIGNSPAGDPIFAYGGIVGVTQDGGKYGCGTLYLAVYNATYNTFYFTVLHDFGE